MNCEEAFKTLKEYLCGLCAYGSQNMESCDIRGCDCRDAIKVIERNIYDTIAHTFGSIRSEIEQRCCITVGQENEPAITLHDVFKIIDKYNAESEDK